MHDILTKYLQGETLRHASAALYRQAKNRFPDTLRPPRSYRPQALPKYDAWYKDEILTRYEDAGLTTEKQLTQYELKADERFFNAVTRAQTAIDQYEEKARLEHWSKFDLDPYGHLTWGVGSEDDFCCFDYDTHEDEMAIVTTLNSETGGFIQSFAGEIVTKDKAVNEAIGQVDQAYEWCGWNDVEPDEEGWNYGGWRFVEAVKKAIGSDEVNPFPSPNEEE